MAQTRRLGAWHLEWFDWFVRRRFVRLEHPWPRIDSSQRLTLLIDFKIVNIRHRPDVPADYRFWVGVDQGRIRANHTRRINDKSAADFTIMPNRRANHR